MPYGGVDTPCSHNGICHQGRFGNGTCARETRDGPVRRARWSVSVGVQIRAPVMARVSHSTAPVPASATRRKASWQGSSCNLCVPKFEGTYCTVPNWTTTCATAKGFCYNGICLNCGKNTANAISCGVACEKSGDAECNLGCPQALYGPECQFVCPGTTEMGEPCMGRGMCDAGTRGRGTCKCKPGYGGVACEVGCPRYQNLICEGRGFL